MTIAGGDTRYRNNIVAPQTPRGARLGGKDALDEDAARLTAPQGVAGTAAYNEYPVTADLQSCASGSPDALAALKLPVDIRDNWYGPGAEPYKHEPGAVRETQCAPSVRVDDRGEEVRLRLDVPASLATMGCPEITAESLGTVVQAEVPFESPDGHPLTIVTDYCGTARQGKQSPGPFADLAAGKQEFVVWPFPDQGRKRPDFDRYKK
jgi:hypothetical protein